MYGTPAGRLACRQTLQKLENVAKFHEHKIAICQPILEFVWKCRANIRSISLL